MAKFLAFDLPTFVPSAGAPTVTPGGANNGKTWGYKLYSEDADGNLTQLGAEGTSAAGSNDLSGVNNNVVSWATDPLAAVKVHVFRSTVPVGSVLTTGHIGTVAAGVKTLNDTGLASDAETAPATNQTGTGASLPVAQYHDLAVQVTGGTFTATVKLEGQMRGATDWSQIGNDVTAEGFVTSIPATLSLIRARMTAYTSGAPAIILGFREKFALA